MAERGAAATGGRPAIIHHLALAAEYAATPAGQPYLPAAYAADGFIHCTLEPDVLLVVANRFYQGAPGEFVVLDVDPARLAAEVRYEAGQPPAPEGSVLAGVLFPHIYGPINCEAVVAVRQARRAPDGRFLEV